MGAGVRRDVFMGRAAAQDLLWKQDPAPVAGVLGLSGPEAWIAFDEEVRRIGRGYDPPPRGKRLEARLCDPDGQIRAAALAAWRFPPLPLVLIRCADWAPPVRERARRVLGRLVAKYPADVLALLTPLALRLGAREHGGWAVEQLEAALTGRYSLLTAWWRPGRPSTTWEWTSLPPAQRAAVLERLHRDADLPARRFAARLAIGAGRTGVRELARRAADEPDPVTARLWTDAALAVMAADGPDDAALDALLRGRHPMVRSAGVTALRRAGRAAEAAAHLADRSGLVRACARWLLRQDGGDARAHYRELLADPAGCSPYAVTGLAECGERAEAEPLLRELLDHRAGAVRAAAAAGLRRLDIRVEDARLLPLLDDSAPAAPREAALSLLPVAWRLDPVELAPRTTPGRRPATRRAAFRLLCAQGGIAALRAAVDLAADPDPGIRRAARTALRRRDWWAGLRESGADGAELRELLARSAELFEDHELGLLLRLLVPRREIQ
ncbi:hypothetical protein [Streptomyces sp. NPDC091371]|uniref:hypothetical protein n=1 Tax=Streptomyces sp. NPDC091371 TaxID=3155303 RepID=UPI003429464D